LKTGRTKIQAQGPHPRQSGFPSESGATGNGAQAPAMATTPSAPASGQRDELAESLADLFTNVSLMVRGELQVLPSFRLELPLSLAVLPLGLDVLIMVSGWLIGTVGEERNQRMNCVCSIGALGLDLIRCRKPSIRFYCPRLYYLGNQLLQASR
jgi:hypothetical protein